MSSKKVVVDDSLQALHNYYDATKQSVLEIKNNTDDIKTAVEGLKDDTTAIKNTTEDYKDQAAASAAAAGQEADNASYAANANLYDDETDFLNNTNDGEYGIYGGRVWKNNSGSAQLMFHFNIEVNTMAEAMAISVFGDYARVHVGGFYSIGDGGGTDSPMYYDPDEDKANHNGGGIIDPDHSATPGDVAGGWYSSENTGTGCLKRPDSDSISLLAWGVTSSDAQNDVRIKSADDYYTGKILKAPHFKVQFSDVLILTGSNRLTGIGRLSHFEQTLGSRDVIIADCPDVEVDHLRLSGAHGDPPGEYQGTEAGGLRWVNLDVNDPQHENGSFHHLFIDDCDTGLFVSGNGFDTDDDGNYEEVYGTKHSDVYNCKITDISRNGIELFLSDYIDCYNNYVEQNDTDFHDTERGIRIVGSRYVKCHDNKVICGDNKYVGIECAPSNVQTFTRLPYDVEIVNNDVTIGDSTGAGTAIMIRGCLGDLKIADNTLRSKTGGYFLNGIKFDTRGTGADGTTKQTVENADISDNKAYNSIDFFTGNGKTGHVYMTSNHWVGADDAGAFIEINKNDLTEEPTTLMVVTDNTMLCKPTNNNLQNVRIINTVAGSTYHVYNNRATETDNDFFGTNGNATFQLGTVGTDNWYLPDSVWEDPQN